MLVGIFILGGITVAVVSIMFLKPSVGDGKQTLYVRFSDIQNISDGKRVLFAGKPIGEVESIHEIKEARKQPTDELGRVYYFELTLKIDSHIKVYNTDEISISTSGLMGEKSISITPKAPPIGLTPKRITNQPIYANSVDMIQNAMVDFSDLAATMEQAFTEVSDWLKTNGGTLATSIENIGGAMKEVDQAVKTYNQTEVINDIQAGVKEFNTTLTDIQYAFNEMKEKNAFQNAGIVMENLRTATKSLDRITDDVVQGKGTLGKLIVDSDLYLEVNAVMGKVNNLMNDINHYGLMFHLNKQWQRTRLKRINELNALNSPTEFRTYFQNEVNDINTSMTRISMLIHRAEESPEREEILSSQAFKNDFAELLRKADQLSDNLRLYNQQLADQAGN